MKYERVFFKACPHCGGAVVEKQLLANETDYVCVNYARHFDAATLLRMSKLPERTAMRV